VFLPIAWFEIRFWLRSWLLWTFLFGIGLMTFLASAYQIGFINNVSATYRNAPFAIENRYALMGVFALLMTTVFVNSAALRDFSYNTHPIIFSTPVRRRDLLLGRFFGATFVALIPMLGVSIGILLAKYTPWTDPSRWMAVDWTAHLQGILLFALPNTFFMASVLFAVAVWSRRESISFIAAFLLFMGFAVGNLQYRDLRFEHAAALLDPLGIRTLALVTKYWTVTEKNTLSAGFGGMLLLNRLLWVAVGCAIFAASYYRFSFTEKKRATYPLAEPEPTRMPYFSQHVSQSPARRRSAWMLFLGSLKVHFLGMAKSTFFVVIGFAILVDVPFLLADATAGFGNQTFPVTYWVIGLIREDVFFFILIIITFYAGVLVWQDREERMDEIIDATPAPEWSAYAARLATLVAMAMMIQAGALAAGVVVQAIHGYERFQFGLYVHELLVRDFSWFLFMAVLALFIHVLASSKYLGYFIFIAFCCANAFLWPALNVTSNLVQFAKRPDVIFSDFFGDAPFRLAWNWFTLYWLLLCVLLAIATVMFWPRGKPDSWKIRARMAQLRFHAGWKAAVVGSLVAFSACGGWIWYNTEVLNVVLGPKDLARARADYERNYKRFDTLPQPRVRSVKYALDIFPSSRNIRLRGEEVIQNPYSHPLEEVHFSLDARYETSITIPGAELSKDDSRLSYRIFRFTSPLQAGEQRTLHFVVESKNRGFENEVSNLQVVENGTFISDLGALVSGANYLGPIIGYDYWRELTDFAERKRYGLKASTLMRPPERNCTQDCGDSYIPGHSDWVEISAIISTSTDQIAVAPGSLVRDWKQDGRHYFEYALDHPSVNLYGIASAGYEVAREDFQGIALEVYYLKEHSWNVPRMLSAMKESLTYYIANFGPYPHKQARIVEFPRVASYAAGFSGIIPFSESIGFIANVNHPDDIDTVFYLVAHEMAHQWWDQQVIGANMEGATLLSETLAQYSALMVMEREYGRDAMRKFLKYEMEGYLRGRGREGLKEQPLLRVQYQQGYVHYNKGGVVFYYLREMIGEDAVNRALRKLMQKYAFAPPPYPSSYELLDALRAESPPEFQYLIKELFEDITLFSNRTLSATAVRREDGKYDVTIHVEARKFTADGEGVEHEVPVDDWIDIGAFAPPEKGRQYGATLFRERTHVTQRDSQFTFTTLELPEKAGIDPFALLIDRIPDDNMMNVTVSSPGVKRP
jgi:ABC-2 type transport system permease protein